MKKKQDHPKAPGVPNRLHLDKRVDAILGAVPSEAADDDLMTTFQVANWFGVSEDWLAIGRLRGYGPPYHKLAPQIVRYKRGELRQYLKERQFLRTSDYSNRDHRLRKVEA